MNIWPLGENHDGLRNGALPRFAIAFPTISRISRIKRPVHSIWTDAYCQLTAGAERHPFAVAPNDHWPARAIRPGLACEAGRVPCALFAGMPGNTRRVDPQARPNSVKLRLATRCLGRTQCQLRYVAKHGCGHVPTATPGTHPSARMPSTPRDQTSGWCLSTNTTELP
jgi:hypothetical protein